MKISELKGAKPGEINECPICLSKYEGEDVHRKWTERQPDERSCYMERAMIGPQMDEMEGNVGIIYCGRIPFGIKKNRSIRPYYLFGGAPILYLDSNIIDLREGSEISPSMDTELPYLQKILLLW